MCTWDRGRRIHSEKNPGYFCTKNIRSFTTTIRLPHVLPPPDRVSRGMRRRVLLPFDHISPSRTTCMDGTVRMMYGSVVVCAKTWHGLPPPPSNTIQIPPFLFSLSDHVSSSSSSSSSAAVKKVFFPFSFSPYLSPSAKLAATSSHPFHHTSFPPLPPPFAPGRRRRPKEEEPSLLSVPMLLLLLLF